MAESENRLSSFRGEARGKGGDSSQGGVGDPASDLLEAERAFREEVQERGEKLSESRRALKAKIDRLTGSLLEEARSMKDSKGDGTASLGETLEAYLLRLIPAVEGMEVISEEIEQDRDSAVEIAQVTAASIQEDVG